MFQQLKYSIFLCLLLLSMSTCALAQQPVPERGEQPVEAQSDSILLSIVTCAPGPEVYALYGHMAIRFQNLSSGDDWVFNYGTFNMNAPFFIPKFVLGLMDYELGLQPWTRFWQHYSYDGCDIGLQLLNLTPTEKKRLMQLLMENYQPENRGYRYNFIYDNCSTRPRDLLEQCVEGKIVYAPDSLQTTYRKQLHGFNSRWPWSKLGVDLVLGQEADAPVDSRQQEFLPQYLAAHLDQAVIIDPQGVSRPLVKGVFVEKAVQPMDETPEFPLDPLPCAVIFLLFSILLFVWEIWKKKLLWAYDLLLFTVQGVTGVILFILFFFSEHPCTGSNWLIFLFNPLPLVFLYRIVKRGISRQSDAYHTVYAVILTLFIIFFALIPQDIPLEVVPLALILWSRHVAHIVLCKRK